MADPQTEAHGWVADALPLLSEWHRTIWDLAEPASRECRSSAWIAPLLAEGTVPSIDLPWPEYVTTPRGEDWWIPTRSEDAAVVP